MSYNNVQYAYERQSRWLVDVHTHGLSFAGDERTASRGLDFDFLPYGRGRGGDWLHQFCRDGLFVCEDFPSVGPGLLLGYGHPVEGNPIRDRANAVNQSTQTHLFFQNTRSLLFLISAMRFIAFIVVWTNSRL